MEKIFIARKRDKNLNIRITRDGQVHVTAPLRMSDADIESILDRKRGWIEKHRGQMLEKARLRPQNFESGETLRVLGKPFRLRVEEGGTPASRYPAARSCSPCARAARASSARLR